MNHITIYRGSHQIGGCATEISTGRQRIVIDFGTRLPGNETGESMTDEELVSAVFDGRPCSGVFFTHYHGDHIGLYRQIPKEVPLYIGKTAKRIMEILTEKLDSHRRAEQVGLPRIQGMNCFSPGKKINLFGNGDIQVTPFVVDHSALDAYMFLIQAGGKRILFTGDFREHGIAGRNDTFEKGIRTYIGKMILRLKHNRQYWEDVLTALAFAEEELKGTCSDFWIWLTVDERKNTKKTRNWKGLPAIVQMP